MIAELVLAFAIVAVCVVMHITGMASLTALLLRRRSQIQQSPGLIKSSLLLIIVFAVVIVLHLAQTIIWAAFYYSRNLFASFETSLYFSLKTYTTIGYGDILLPEHWRLLGGIEGLCGVLLCGVSTAFIFAILSALFQIRTQARTEA
jgi:voltage-gated potassium channel Kch